MQSFYLYDSLYTLRFCLFYSCKVFEYFLLHCGITLKFKKVAHMHQTQIAFKKKSVYCKVYGNT